MKPEPVFKYIRSLTMDAKKPAGKFKASSTAERDFYRQLKKVAQTAGHIVDQHIFGVTIENSEAMMRELRRYSELIEPWARRQSLKLLQKVQRSNKLAYDVAAQAQRENSVQMALLTKTKIAEPNIGAVALALMNEQVGLIKSIPIEAGQRAQKIAFEAAVSGTRAAPDDDTIAELQKQLGLTTEVATSRAQLIAITETARANASINQARALAVGSRKYRWHNSGDEAVRHSHKFYKGQRLQGRIFDWDHPPTLDDGMTGHPGTFPRCRCFAEPIFDE